MNLCYYISMKDKKLSSHRRRNYKFIFVILGIIVLCAGGGVAFALLTHKADTSSDDSIGAPASSVRNPVEQTDEINADTEKEDTFNEVPQYEGENPNNLGSITGIINYTSVIDGNLLVRVSIDQFLSAGTCKLTLSAEGAKDYTAEAPIVQVGGTTSSCDGFDIPVAELSASPKWNINIVLSSDNKTGLIVGEASL